MKKHKKTAKVNNYEIKNQAGSDSAELLLYGIIGDYWDELDAKDIVEDLRSLDVNVINVRIYSDGGSVFAGLAIYNALKNHKAQINVIIDSLAASIASVIAMSGHVEMPENAFMMIHNPWGGAFGEASDMEKMAEILSKIKTSLVGVYKDKTGLDETKLSEMMDTETWLSAKEAVELGFADVVTGQADPKNLKKQFFNSLNNYKNVPERLKALARNEKQTTTPPDSGGKDRTMEITLELIKNEHPEIAKALKDEGAAAAQKEQREAGAEAERQRIKDVAAQRLPGHETLVDSMMYDGKSTAGDVAMAVLQAEKKIRVNAKTNLDADAIKPVDHVPAPDTPASVKKHEKVTEANCKKEFEANLDNCQAEHDDFESYFAYRKATADGRVRILGNK